jgi:hypothetical protein
LLVDWYGGTGGEAGEAQQHRDASSDLEIVPPVSNVVQPVVLSASESQPVRQAQSAQILGLGPPPAIQQSDSVRRRVTPIPSGPFHTPPSPRLDHSSNDLETPPGPSHDRPAPANQLPALAPQAANQPPDSPPAEQSTAPSKRGKDRGLTQNNSKASGSCHGGRQRAKATASIE